MRLCLALVLLPVLALPAAAAQPCPKPDHASTLNAKPKRQDCPKPQAGAQDERPKDPNTFSFGNTTVTVRGSIAVQTTIGSSPRSD
jgi:hypothetical protein